MAADNSYKLQWDLSTDNVGVSHYKVWEDGVYRADIGNIPHPTNTAYLGSVPPSGCFAVTAVDLVGNESILSAPCVQFEDVFNPTIPPNVVASLIADTTFTLSWDAADDNVGVTQYAISYGPSGSYVQYAVVGNVLSIDITGQTPGATEDWMVAAGDAAGNWGGYSTPVTVTQTISIPAVPTALKSTLVSQTTFSLAWTGDANATGYKVFRNGVLYGDVGNVVSTPISGQVADDTNVWTVSAYNTSGESAESVGLTVTQSPNVNAILISYPGSIDGSTACGAVAGTTYYKTGLAGVAVGDTFYTDANAGTTLNGWNTFFTEATNSFVIDTNGVVTSLVACII